MRHMRGLGGHSSHPHPPSPPPPPCPSVSELLADSLTGALEALALAFKATTDGFLDAPTRPYTDGLLDALINQAVARVLVSIGVLKTQRESTSLAQVGQH